MSPPTDTSSFSLRPVIPADFPSMAEMCGLSCETDRHTMLKAAHPTNPYNHAAGMTGAFEYWTSLPAGRCELTKAVDDATGETMGFVCWGMKLGEVKPSKEEGNSQGAAPEGKETEVKEASSDKPGAATSANAVQPRDPLEQLEEFTSSHLDAFQKRFRGTRCMYIVTITVHPVFQGRGVGKALIKQGTDRADAEGVLCWVHSSEAAVHAYKKCGFQEDDTLEIDLDEWATKLSIKPPAGNDKWGTYTFTYMIRQPITA